MLGVSGCWHFLGYYGDCLIKIFGNWKLIISGSRLNSLPLSLRITLHQKNKTRSSNTCKILWKINFLSPSKSVTKCCYCMTHIVSSPTLGQGHWKFPLTFCGLLTVTVWKGKKIKLWGFYTFSNHFWPVFFCWICTVDGSGFTLQTRLLRSVKTLMKNVSKPNLQQDKRKKKVHSTFPCKANVE